ncbi:hypothetical protein Tcan_15388 [Toxocara canis]|uniref:Treslin STD domain-containing protein n=1 Tax=Toxocara canis TaxID=6265 RepID=A0A0B2VZV8_TOXCA|nr:hypothetical protein Tcan_15388 [Toxocara canis]
MGTRASNFEEIAFALFQALNPGKKLSREQIPYKQLRGLVGELVSDHRIQHIIDSPSHHPFTSNGKFFNKRSVMFSISNNSTLNGEERNGSSTLDVSDDSSSRISFEESFSTRSKSMLRSMTSSRKMLSASRVPRQARGMMQIRARRRKASYTPRFTSFECTEEELRSGFSSFHEKLLDTCATSIECYHVIINSLNNFFTHNTWTNNVERLVNEFMHDNVLMSCAELGAKYDRCGESGDGGRRLREYELMALLEIRLLGENCAAAVEESDVLNKLRFIYFAGDLQRLRDFLDETISDQFAHVKPLVVTRIYEELCMKLPFDLQIYAREESKDTEGEFELESAAVLQRRAGQAESLDRLINGDDSDESLDCPPANASYIERHRTSATERSSRHPYKSKNESWEGPSESKADRHQLVRRSFSVPETPESKMKKKRPPPNGSSRRSRPLIAVLKKSDERLTEGTSKPSSSGVGLLMKYAKKKTASSQISFSPNSFLPTPPQQSSPSTGRPPTRSQSSNVVRINENQLDLQTAVVAVRDR